jgi:enamine deaminase RidA (YjgF/YER057c/UK114 family)
MHLGWPYDVGIRHFSAGYLTVDAKQIVLEPDPFRDAHISQGFRVGDLIVLSGQVAMDENGQWDGGRDFDAQADQAMRNVQRALRAAGSDVDKIFKVTIYLTDMKYRSNVIAMRRKWFREPWPADTLVAVAALGTPERLIEIEVMALANGSIRTEE